jgi:hypothetical protein
MTGTLQLGSSAALKISAATAQHFMPGRVIFMCSLLTGQARIVKCKVQIMKIYKNDEQKKISPPDAYEALLIKIFTHFFQKVDSLVIKVDNNIKPQRRSPRVYTVSR